MVTCVAAQIFEESPLHEALAHGDDTGARPGSGRNASF
jgi:hypothetical protein